MKEEKKKLEYDLRIEERIQHLVQQRIEKRKSIKVSKEKLAVA